MLYDNCLKNSITVFSGVQDALFLPSNMPQNHCPSYTAKVATLASAGAL
jgi:hypothetical protein